jgi:hypothetical protein
MCGVDTKNVAGADTRAMESSQGGEKSSNWNSKIAFEQIDDCSGGRVGCSKCEASIRMTFTATQIIECMRKKKTVSIYGLDESVYFFWKSRMRKT